MCGIAGVAGGNLDQERDAVKRMTLALAHRGPDDSGHYEDEDVVLGNRRLAIIDVSDAGRQPLADAEGRFLITFNGEIYNYRQLRTALEKAGHRFRTHTDTEVLLEMYRRHGADSLHRLRGMFSFAIWDRQERRLFAARDPFGQKPFYYAIVRNRLIFASEIKSILAHGDVPVEPDTSAIDHYLSLRFIPPPLTMFRAIRKLPAGHRLVWNEGQVYVESYFTPDFTPAEARSEDEWLSGLREHIEDAVADHMVSDVPYGAYLSGGLDSGAVVAADPPAAIGR